jgi:hypothetical protein
MQFLQHPMPVHPLLLGVVQDVDLPDSKANLPIGWDHHRGVN